MYGPTNVGEKIDVLPVERGGTGNRTGYVTAGQKAGTNLGEKATAEGNNTTASGKYSHAEGYRSEASGDYSHAEGNAEAGGDYSHAEGYNGVAAGEMSHVEGLGSVTTQNGKYGHAEGNYTSASEESAHAEGERTAANGKTSHAEGNHTTAQGNCSHAEGSETLASGDAAHAEGKEYTNPNDAADITKTTASGDAAHAEGCGTTASGDYSHAEGNRNVASGVGSHAEGIETEASGRGSHAGGIATIAEAVGQTAIGTGNVADSDFNTPLIVGGGSYHNRSNCFRVTTTGAFGAGAYNSSGADYAELFQWQDGNPDRQDRAGRFVTLDGDKIRMANPDNSYVVGIVSGSPSVVGDVYDDQWAGMYLTDVFGRPVWETADVPEETDGAGNVIVPAHTERRRKLNPDYDPSKPYLPRSQRPEWDAVGLLGKLVAIDDGSCAVNGWAKPGVEGIATASEWPTRFRVIARLDENHIRVLILNTSM